MQIDPWGSSQFQDYTRLRDQFGIEPFGPDEWGCFDEPHKLLRRGVVFGHRDFQRIKDAVRNQDPWSLMTGLMPSGNMHMGHKMLIDQVVGHQQNGADVHLAVADFEAAAARGMSLDKARSIAMDQYVRNYLALGLDPNKAEVYFQSTRTSVKDLAHQFASKVNLSQMQALYGFGGDTSVAHVMAPLIQAADILHVQHDEVGPRPVLVPVGVDQDPHIRLTRDIAKSWRRFNVQKEDGKLAIYVKGDEDVEAWLNRAEATVRGLGIGEIKRNDRYKAMYISGGTKGDRRAVDQALAAMEYRKGSLSFAPPVATYHRFMTGLTGSKMSSSQPDSSVFLTDEPDAAVKKLRSSVTGGKATADEQRAEGADPESCPVYEMYLYHLADSDSHLQQVHDECKGGQRLCGGCKGEASELLKQFLLDHREKRDATEHLVGDVVVE